MALHSCVSDGTQVFIVAKMDESRLKRIDRDTGELVWAYDFGSETGAPYPWGLQQDASGLYLLLGGYGLNYTLTKRSKVDGSEIWTQNASGSGLGTGLFCYGDHCYIAGAWYDDGGGYFLERRLKSTGESTDLEITLDPSRTYERVFVDSTGIYVTIFSYPNIAVRKLDLAFNMLWEVPILTQDPEDLGVVLITDISADDLSIHAVGDDYNLTTLEILGLYVSINKSDGSDSVYKTWPELSLNDGFGQCMRGIAVLGGNTYIGGHRSIESIDNPLDTKRVMQRNFPPWVGDGHWPV